MINTIKKILLVIASVVLLSGCAKETTDNLKNFKDYNSEKETYKLTGTMKIRSNEDEFTYDIEVGVKDNKYYKVSLTNTNNNHNQIILKNDDGVYVITPKLNKSYKFSSTWPKNSSQSYLIDSLVNDVISSADTKLENDKDGYKITTKVNYPNNVKLDHEIIYTDTKFNIKKIEVYNENDEVEIEVNINDIDYKNNFDDDYFLLETYVTEETKEDNDKCIEECRDTSENCKSTCNTETTSNILDEIIYPLYIPTDTYLANKETVETDDGSRVIMTFSGVDPFILVEEVSKVSSEFDVIPVNGEPLFLSSTIGAISDNSISWSSNGRDYYITSKSLSKDEMMTIAESIQNSTNLVAVTK